MSQTVTQPDTLRVLERLLAGQCSSLAQYLSESWPWAGPDDRSALELIQSVAADERGWAEELAELIERRGGVPRPASYPSEFSGLNFLALEYVLPKVAQEVRESVGELERALAAMGDDPQARTLVQRMIERKRGQIEAIQKLSRQR